MQGCIEDIRGTFQAIRSLNCSLQASCIFAVPRVFEHLPDSVSELSRIEPAIAYGCAGSSVNDAGGHPGLVVSDG
jgi:hypothetical protein